MTVQHTLATCHKPSTAILVGSGSVDGSEFVKKVTDKAQMGQVACFLVVELTVAGHMFKLAAGRWPAACRSS